MKSRSWRGGDAVRLGQPENIDQLLARMPDDMRAEDRIGLLVDDHLRPGLVSA